MSLIGLECKTCHARYKIKPDTAATKITCQRCGSGIHIPAGRRPTGSSPATGTGGERVTGRGGRRRTTVTASGITTRKRGSASTAYLFGALALLVLVGGLVFMLR